MKTIILTIALLSVSFINYAQVDSVLVTNTNTEKLVDKYVSKIEASLLSLAEGLKQPAEHVYKVLVKQQYIDAWSKVMNVLALVFFLIIFDVCFEKSKWKETSPYTEISEDELFNKHAVMSIASGVLFLAFLISSACQMTDILQGFFNPEYGAIEDILEMLKY